MTFGGAGCLADALGMTTVAHPLGARAVGLWHGRPDDMRRRTVEKVDMPTDGRAEGRS